MRGLWSAWTLSRRPILLRDIPRACAIDPKAPRPSNMRTPRFCCLFLGLHSWEAAFWICCILETFAVFVWEHSKHGTLHGFLSPYKILIFAVFCLTLHAKHIQNRGVFFHSITSSQNCQKMLFWTNFSYQNKHFRFFFLLPLDSTRNLVRCWNMPPSP